MLNECGICRQRRDQHLLAKCDTCHLYYHLDCLNPPLSRLPKKSKLYGWQCSECDKTSDSEVEEVKTPRRSRSRYSKENKSDQETSSPPKLKIKPVAPAESKSNPTSPLLHVRKHSHSLNKTVPSLSTSHDTNIQDMSLNSTTESNSLKVILDNCIEGHKSAKKRRREKHRNRYSPDLGISSKEHKRKRKKKSLDIEDTLPHPRITIKVEIHNREISSTLHFIETFPVFKRKYFLQIKPIPLPAGEVASESNPQCFYVRNEEDDNGPPPLPPKMAKIEKREVRKSRSPRVSDAGKSEEKYKSILKKPGAASSTDTICDVCQEEGSNNDSVK